MTNASVSRTPSPGKRVSVDTRKPYKGFPLTFHPTGRFCKKSKGVTYYYGRVSEGWQSALDAFNRFWPFDSTGRARPLGDGDGLTVARMCDHYYEAKRNKHEAGELAHSSLADYEQTCKGIVAALKGQRLVTDLDARDFTALRASLAKRLGPVALGNEVNRVRMVFNFAFKNGLIDRPTRFGSEFIRPSRKVLRLHKAEQSPKMMAAADVLKLIKAASVPMQAMILLGINAALGNKDCSDLNQSHIDLTGGWLTFPRQKTGVARRCPLWPETIKAVQAAIVARPEPVEAADGDAVFITAEAKRRWVRGIATDAILQEFKKLLVAHGLHRKGVGFYVLRHVHRTVSDEAKDQRAAGVIMGHEDPHISSTYVERVSDARLQAVADHVHRWLFNEPMAMNTTGKRGDK